MENNITFHTLPNGIQVATINNGTINDVIRLLGYNTNEVCVVHKQNSNGDFLGGLKKLFQRNIFCIISIAPLTSKDISLMENDNDELDSWNIENALEEAVQGYSDGVEENCIRQIFLESVFMRNAINNQLQGAGYTFYFNNGVLENYEASKGEYNSNARAVIGEENLAYYYSEGKRYYSDHDRIVQEINLLADSICVIPIDILESTAPDNFRYSNGLVNYIALALFYNLITISQNEFIDSTHRKYEIISSENVKGIKTVRVKAYGKTFTFFDGCSNLIDSIKTNEVDDTKILHNGFVYVLINPSIKGLVKIGKTTKDPNERAKELSSATGVATPFIVVYYRAFDNCDAAEQIIHKYLEAKGVRYNSSREFFEMETSEAVNIISSIQID